MKLRDDILKQKIFIYSQFLSVYYYCKLVIDKVLLNNEIYEKFPRQDCKYLVFTIYSKVTTINLPIFTFQELKIFTRTHQKIKNVKTKKTNAKAAFCNYQ